MYRPISLPILLALLPAPIVPAAGQVATVVAAPADEAAIDALVRRIYGRYHGDRLVPLPDAAIYTPDTLALMRENARRLHGDVGAVDGDVFVDAQDFGQIEVEAITLTPRPDGRAGVVVRFSDPANDVHGKLTTLVVARTGAGWRVHDVTLAAGGSLRAALADENRRLKRRRRAR